MYFAFLKMVSKIVVLWARIFYILFDYFFKNVAAMGLVLMYAGINIFWSLDCPFLKNVSPFGTPSPFDLITFLSIFPPRSWQSVKRETVEIPVTCLSGTASDPLKIALTLPKFIVWNITWSALEKCHFKIVNYGVPP
jgi:hypothetical protein